jgi:hypothetical protein
MLQQAVGQPFNPPTSQTESPGTALQAVECRYTSSSSDRALFTYFRYASAATATAGYASDRRTLGGTDVSGVGDAAFFAGQTGSIEVRKGAVVFDIAAAVIGAQQQGPERHLGIQVAAEV